MGDLYLPALKEKHSDYEIIKEYPLSKKLLALSYAWRVKEKNEIIISSKGAPEAILSLCRASKEKEKKF